MNLSKEANIVALIPARAGSKRIKNKNLKEFHGKPIIQYSIEAAVSSRLFNKIIVSSDINNFPEYLFNNKVEFQLRSSENSNDFATISQVILEVVEKLGLKTGYLCLIYATAPLIDSSDLQKSFELLNNDVDCVLPVVQFSFPIQRALKILDGTLQYTNPEFEFTRSQDIEPRYHDSGTFFWINITSFLNKGRVFTEKTVPYLLRESKCQDIDNLEDWLIAEIKYSILNKEITDNL